MKKHLIKFFVFVFIFFMTSCGGSGSSAVSSEPSQTIFNDELIGTNSVAIGTTFQDTVESNIEFIFPEEFYLMDDDDSLSTYRSHENPSNNILIGDWIHIIPDNPIFTETFSVEVCGVTGLLVRFRNNGYFVWLLEFDYGDTSRTIYFRSDRDLDWSYDSIVDTLATCSAPTPDDSGLDDMSLALDGTRFIDSDDPTVQFLFPSSLTHTVPSDTLQENGLKAIFALESFDIYISISEINSFTSTDRHVSEPIYICGVYGVSFTNESDLGILRLVEFSKNSRNYRVLALLESHTGFSNQDLDDILNTCPR